MHNQKPILFSRDDIDFILGADTLFKGEVYQKKRYVQDLKISKEGKEILARVTGKVEVDYKVRIKITQRVTKKSSTVDIQGDCSCYVGYNCKHVAATLIEVLEQAKKNTSDTVITSHSERMQSKFLSALPAIGLAKKPGILADTLSEQTKTKNNTNTRDTQSTNNTENIDANTSKTEQWTSFLDDIQKNSQAQNHPVINAQPKHEFIYILDVSLLADKRAWLTVEIQSVNILKKGGYGAHRTAYIFTLDKASLLPADRAIIEKIQKLPNYHYADAQHLLKGDRAFIHELVSTLIQTNRCYWKKIEGLNLALGDTLVGNFVWEPLGTDLQKLSCTLENKTILATEPLWYLDNKTDGHTLILGPLETQWDDETAASLIHCPPLTRAQAEKLRTKLLKNIESSTTDLSLPVVLPVYKTELKKGTPVPVLELVSHLVHDVASGVHEIVAKNVAKNKEPSAVAVLKLRYDELVIDFNNPLNILEYNKDGILTRIERDKEKELAYLDIIKAMHVKPLKSLSAEVAFAIQLPFMFDDVPRLCAQNWQLDIAPDFPLQCAKEEEWYTEVEESADYDWFGFELGILVEGKKINVLPLLVQLLEHNPHILDTKKIQDLDDDHIFHLQLPDKRYVAIKAGRVKSILSVLVELYDKRSLNNDILKVRPVQAAQLLGLQQSLQARWLGSEKLRILGEKLSHFEGIQSCAVPENFKGKLRPYQKEGLDWLAFLREFQLGGILADDMGLGKTVQVLVHLLAEKQSGRQRYPNLIIAPTSLMTNWENEAKRFTPDLKVLILQGTNRHIHFESIRHADIVLSTYPLINRDKDLFLEHQFHYLILDEAQYIKNPYTKAYQVLLEVKAMHTLCMTGTPMENHLGELWSLFHFTVPGLLADNKKFKKWFRDPIEKEGDITRQKSLATRIRPFILRRTKEQVVTELPPKTEIIHTIELSGPQLDLYESIRLAMQQKVVSAVQNKGLMRSQILILDALLKLRQTCNDPRLLPLEKARQVHDSAKRAFLMDMLPTLIEEGRKILLFSSFASMLDLLEEECIKQNIAYVKLSGRTKDRNTPINQFQNGEVPLMLISLKAGGVGLNLTAADTVIHYDPWWNPAAEAQATDRAHRIGQTKPVFVYKLVCKGTVEEKILKMQGNKKRLLKGVLNTQENQIAKLSSEDLVHLFDPIENI